MEKSNNEKHELFEKIWNKYKDELTKFCNYKMQSCFDEIDDVIADTFFYLWKAILDEKEIFDYRGWLFTVTDRLIMKKYTQTNRAKKRYIPVEDMEDELACFLSEEVFVDSMVSDMTIENASRKIVHDLTSEEYELYNYIYQEKLKYKKIAEIMNSTEKAIKQKKYRLNIKLKKIIKKQLESMWMLKEQKGETVNV